jgi:hemoglobin/transferrin/lactoferrin receptor protein
VGVTPIPGITPYVTYAEGYRAPAVTETLVSGLHPVAFAPFTFIPNPGLNPEVGKNKEAGINLRFDDVWQKGDAFRAKGNVYRNDVSNYIETVNLFTGQAGQGGITCTFINPFPGQPDCVQYQNITQARLEGFEVESAYDQGWWFAGFNFSHVKGRNTVTQVPLSTIPPDMATTTLGVRLLDRKLTLAVRWQSVAAKERQDIPPPTGQPTFPATQSYDLVNLYATYQQNPDVLWTASIENVFDQYYSVYTTYFPNPSGGSAPPIALPGPGLTVKGALKLRFGDDFFKQASKLTPLQIY